MNGGKWRVVAEFTEIESGRKSDRPVLNKALAAARVHKATLVVAKIDRLIRSQAFLNRLLEENVDIRFADLPQIEGPTGRFLIQQMAAVAELEAGMISRRTKDALAAAKRRGKKLGGDRGARLTRAQRAAGNEVMTARAKQRAADLKPVIDEIRRAGVVSFSGIAIKLNERSIPTARGEGWSATQVMRVMQRLAA